MPTKQKKSLKITFIFFRQNQFLVKFSKKGFYFFHKTWVVPMYGSMFFFVGNKTFFFLFLLFSHSFFDVEKTKKREREKNYFVDLKEYQEKKLIYPDFLLETNQKNGEYLKKTIF